ncbi:MAG TPA: hypothetical protein VMV15_02450 [Candidatus Binataceae bacterium]|nr:hypothetical protein [Candidatus Binataceae bacterium]
MEPKIVGRNIGDGEPGRPGASTIVEARRVSLLSYSPGLVAVAIAIADSIAVIDPDLWGHVRFGQAFLANRGPLFRDPYSYSAFGHSWVDYEWLGDVVMAAAFNHLGLAGLLMLKLGCAAVLVIFLVMALAETGASTQIQFGVLVFAAVVIRPQLQFRPQSFTMAMLAILMWLLARDAYRRAGRLWLAVPLIALWANLHGGFVMGIAALGIYAAISGLQDLLRNRDYRRILSLTAIVFAAALATLATPYGFHTWVAIVAVLRDPFTHDVITEWQPLLPTMVLAWRVHGPHVSNYEIGVGLMAAMALVWPLSIEAADLPLVAIAAAFSLAAFIAQRNLPLAAIAIAVPLARHLHLLVTRRSGLARRARWSPGWWWLNQALLVAIACAILIQGGALARSLRSTDPYPVSACDFMQRHHLAGNILNDYEWGEYLIWRMAPHSRVFIDGREDTAYPLKIIATYMLFHYDLFDGGPIFKDFHHDYILIRADAKSRLLVDSNPHWKLIYEDPAARLYAPAASAAARLPGVPIKGVALPVRFP